MICNEESHIYKDLEEGVQSFPTQRNDKCWRSGKIANHPDLIISQYKPVKLSHHGYSTTQRPFKTNAPACPDSKNVSFCQVAKGHIFKYIPP